MNTLILSGFGTNCERETAYACTRAGGAERGSRVDVRHINAFYNEGLRLGDYHFLVLIGGFLDGDDLGAARACANRFRYRPLPGGGTVHEALQAFVAEGRLVLGICNGFQVLAKLGLLGDDGEASPGEAARQRVSVTVNANGRFEDRWVHLAADAASPAVYTRDLQAIELPVRHGEGRVVGESAAWLNGLVESHLAPLRYAGADGAPTEAYPANPNGSSHGIAALCNARGTVMGLMPHPEAFNHPTNHPRWTRRPPDGEDGDGLRLFRNAYAYLREQGA